MYSIGNFSRAQGAYSSEKKSRISVARVPVARSKESTLCSRLSLFFYYSVVDFLYFFIILDRGLCLANVLLMCC